MSSNVSTPVTIVGPPAGFPLALDDEGRLTMPSDASPRPDSAAAAQADNEMAASERRTPSRTRA
jgi:hypothetical protein